MTYDLIIVSKSTPILTPVTQRCIDSARAEGNVDVILIETGNPYKYKGVDKFIQYNGEFNYNRALNLGLKHVKGDIYILANNDLIFRPGWSKIGDLMRMNGYHSASAYSVGTPVQKDGMMYEGYAIGAILNGWCIFIDRTVLDAIGKLDETMTFWFSDNLYGEQIKTAGIKHALFTSVQVDHIGSATLKKTSTRMRRKYELGELGKFNERQRYYDCRHK